MPWSGKSFSKHNKKLGKAAAGKAASVANAVLKDSGDEGKAIRIANWNAAGRPKRRFGGQVKAGQAYQVGEEGPETYEGSPADEREDRAGQAKLSKRAAGARVRKNLRHGTVSAKAANKRFGGKDQEPLDASSR
jgi:uncharacterized protein YdaT